MIHKFTCGYIFTGTDIRALKRYLNSYVHSMIHNSQKGDQPKQWRMNKQKLMHTSIYTLEY
jgi:hypothetical protein